MSEENVDLVKATFDAWNDGKLEDVLPFVVEDIEWLEVEGRPEAGVEGEVQGRNAVRSMLESLFDAWESYRLEPEEIRDLGGDRVFAVLREVARGLTSGAEVASRWGYIVTIRDGKLARVEAYRNPERAVEAAGLSE